MIRITAASTIPPKGFIKTGRFSLKCPPPKTFSPKFLPLRPPLKTETTRFMLNTTATTAMIPKIPQAPPPTITGAKRAGISVVTGNKIIIRSIFPIPLSHRLLTGFLLCQPELPVPKSDLTEASPLSSAPDSLSKI